jgi:hypothetical protein
MDGGTGREMAAMERNGVVVWGEMRHQLPSNGHNTKNDVHGPASRRRVGTNWCDAVDTININDGRASAYMWLMD